MNHPTHTDLRSVTRSCVAILALLALAGCGGGGGKGTSGAGAGGSAKLTKIEYGRLVDVYAFRRVNATKADRRDTMNRVPALVARDVVVSANIESQPLFDVIGEERTDADYRILPFDVLVGHEELLILWDDQAAAEQPRFAAALNRATGFLTEVPASYRDQNTSQKPIPVVPRNAALLLTFDRALSVDDAFFAANPTAVQMLEFKADPKTTNPALAFRPVLTRVITKGSKLIVDTTLIGSETKGGQSTTGLPTSSDNVTANLRLALPTSGLVSKQFKVEADGVAALNGPDSRGDTAVIRDFRSGNAGDGKVGALTDTEAPMIIAHVPMGVIAIDTSARVLTLNKRFSRVAVRGRLPFVDGGISPTSGLPSGPGKIPTDQPLRAGDTIYQDVPTAQGGTIRLRAEILQNLDVGTLLGDPLLPTLGLDSNGTDGGNASTVRVKVASLTFSDESGSKYSFQASDLPLGADCTVRVHYYENVPYNSNFGTTAVSDSSRRNEFLVIDPAPPVLDKNRNPVPKGSLVDPMAGVSLRLSEPMDLDSLEPLNNYLIANVNLNATNFASEIKLPKKATAGVIATRPIDQDSNGTLLRLTPPLGLFHEATKIESYFFHTLFGPGGIKDLSGNPLDSFDRRIATVSSFSVEFKLNPDAQENWVGSHVWRFEDLDEDGTPPGSVDLFGQFRLQGGRLLAAATTRFSKVADNQSLQGVFRGEKGECFTDGGAGPPVVQPGNYGPWGPLYLTPSMIATQQTPPQVFQPPFGPQQFGGIVEPHNARGCRLQMTYHEDVFGLGYHDPSTMMIDVEQMYWAEWFNRAALYDVFDRYTLSLGHADWRPDLRTQLAAMSNPPACSLVCDSLKSGLRSDFLANALEGTTLKIVAKDVVYRINPNESFVAASGTTFTPYARFEKSFTWRDSRAVTWDVTNNRAVGLGGAHSPNAQPGTPARDVTANVSSPWVPDWPLNRFQYGDRFTGPVWIMDEDDFWGDRTRDLDPIAMPLLLEFKVYPDDSTNGIANSANQFHIGHMGPLWPGTPPLGCGYYNYRSLGGCPGLDWSVTRVHTTGGFDPQNNIDVKVNPDNTYVATGAWIKDMGLGDPIAGLYKTKYGDSHIHWAQADFVRKVSMATFGFIDTLRPNQAKVTSAATTLTPGFPDFTTLGANIAAKDFVTIVDPPITGQPAGTSVKIEFRGATTIPGPTPVTAVNHIYDRKPNETASAVIPTLQRGNILNPDFACDAYREAMPNSPTTPRVPTVGLTPYVVEEQIDSLRDVAKRNLPRYLNWRVVFENNTLVTPATSPSLRSMSIVYRMAKFD